MRGDRPRVIVEEYHRVRQRDHLADRRDQGRRPVLPADRPPPGSGRLSRKLAARGDVRERRCTRRRTRPRKVVDSARRPRHVRRRILHRAATRRSSPNCRPRPHDTGMVTLISQSPERVRAAPARDPRPADPGDRAGRPVGIGGDPRRPRRATTSASKASPRRLPSAAPGTPVDLRLFAKPNTLKNRRMGVALARGRIDRGGGRDGGGRGRGGQDPLRRLTEAFAAVRRWTGERSEPMSARLAVALVGDPAGRGLRPVAADPAQAADRRPQRGAGPAAQARRHEPRDRAQARDL